MENQSLKLEIPKNSERKKEELTKLFVHSLSGVYYLKQNLLNYLPFISSKITNTALRLTVLDTSSDIDFQMVRFQMILKLLNENLAEKEACVGYSLNLEDYINCNDGNLNNYQRDFSFLVKLTVVESIAISCFRVLKKLAAQLRYKDVHNLIQESLKEAVAKKAELDRIADSLTA